MAGFVSRRPKTDTAKTPGIQESSWTRRILITLAATWVALFLVLPMVNVMFESLRKGLDTYRLALTEPDTLSAIKLTVLITAISVPCNALFGIAAAWTIGKYNFRGKALLLTLIDLPFAISPIVAGLSFIVLFGSQG
ncbi:MAG TPA: sulfate ABC transporter permease subunit CysW, partial [Candidatus Limnocylindria bacterium]|nr:sulfate ABC transporter permease subunit CysW [Candidatus Limnocylindria bacterium]